MTTFWKGFAIFWIIFLVWYLTGGPQRVNTNGAKPTKTFDLNSVTASPDDNNQTSSLSTPESGSNLETTEKSFSDKPKTNTINVNN
jgi:hypothetical protein